VAADNALDVDVRAVHSTEAESSAGGGWCVAGQPPVQPRAALLTHELLDSGLLSEGLLAATRHACDVLLAPSATSVPHSIRLYAQLVQSEYLRDASAQGSESLNSLLPLPASVADCEGAAGYLELNALPLLRRGAVPLAPPVQLLELDLSSRPPPGEQQLAPQPIGLSAHGADGGATTQPDAVVTWWDCTLHPEVADLSTSPWAANTDGLEREHWLNAIFLCSRSEEPTRPKDEFKSRPQDEAKVTCDGASNTASGDVSDGFIVGGFDDDELWVDWRAGRAVPAPSRRRVCRCGVHVLWGAERLQQIKRLYSTTTEVAVAAAVEAARLAKGAPPRCVDLADGPMLRCV